MLADTLRLSDRQRQILSVIERADGRTVLDAEILAAMYPAGLDKLKQPVATMRILIFQLRKIMALEKTDRHIETIWRKGYRLTPRDELEQPSAGDLSSRTIG